MLCGGGYSIANALVAFRPCQSFRTHTFAPPAMLIEETGPQMLVFVLEHGLSFQHPCANRARRASEGDGERCASLVSVADVGRILAVDIGPAQLVVSRVPRTPLLHTADKHPAWPDRVGETLLLQTQGDLAAEADDVDARAASPLQPYLVVRPETWASPVWIPDRSSHGWTSEDW